MLVLILVFGAAMNSFAQCSICTKTAMQLGEEPATGMNSGVIYLMLTPFAVVGYVGYRWWKTEKQFEAEHDTPSSQS